MNVSQRNRLGGSGQAAEETSCGNAGLIQREGVCPYGFPHDFGSLMRYAVNRTIDASCEYVGLCRRLGGEFAQGNAVGMKADGALWRLRMAQGGLTAAAAVVALGPWADLLTRALGYDLRLP